MMWIMISGPYTHGSGDPQVWNKNLAYLNHVALAVCRKGYMPVIGVNHVLPLIDAAGGQAHYQEMMMPLCVELAQRCDAVLRVGGESKGADMEVAVFKEKQLPVYHHIDELPDLSYP